MEVKKVMRKKVITVRRGMSIAEAAKVLLKNNVTGAPVVDKDNKLIGVVSEKDIFKILYPNYQEYYSFLGFKEKETDIQRRIARVGRKKVEEVMTKKIVSVKPADSVFKAGAIMLIKNINRVLVVDKGRLRGIVGRKDIYPRAFEISLEVLDVKHKKK
jgi:CBS domain-containing protein